MNREESLHLFVKNNISFLSSDKATRDIVKNMRQDFYKKNNLRSNSFFRIKDIAVEIVCEVSKLKSRESSEFLINQILTIPFVNNELSKEIISDLIVEYRSEGKSILSKQDFSKLKTEPYRKQIEEKFRQEAIKEVSQKMQDKLNTLDELISQVEKEKEFLLNFKSELDEFPLKVDFQEEDLFLDNVETFEKENWWKEIGLLSNPFPSTEGLIGIPKELYDKIVVRTRFVESYLAKVENNPQEFLGKTIAIMGEFGSGKTTLLNMICYKLGSKGILPCKIMLIPSPDANSIVKELLRQIGSQLERIISESGGLNRRGEYGFIDSLSKLSWVIEDYKKFGGKGLIISVDGLHKESEYFPQTVNFLKQLQNIHEYIHDINELPCGFLIAGSMFWEKEIDRLKSTSGSIYYSDLIPNLTESEAVEFIVKRINAFTPLDHEPIPIKRDTIRLAYRTYSERAKELITFRNFMKYIKDRLEVGKYEEVGIDISSHHEIVGTIKKYVKDSIISNEYEEIEKEIEAHPELRIIIANILTDIYRYDGISEKDPLFRKYTKVFNLLKTTGFIVPRKSKRKDEKFVWAISPNLALVLKEILKEYYINPIDATSSFFENEKDVITRETTTLYSTLISKLSGTIVTLKDSWPEIISDITEVKSILLTLEEKIKIEELDEFDSYMLSESCKILLKSVLKAGGKDISENTDIDKLFKSFWYAPENLEDILTLCNCKQKKYGSYPEIFGAMQHHAEILEQLVDLLKDLTRGELITRLVNRELINEDMRIIHKARILFLDQLYADTVDVICSLLEEKVRNILYVVIRSLWGEDWRKIIPMDILDKLLIIEKRGHPRTKRSLDVNFLYDISRSEYSKILFQKQLKKVFFGEEITTPEFTKMKDMWDLAFSLGDREAHRDRASYFRQHATEIADVLRYLPKMCEKFQKIAERILFDINFIYERKGNNLIGKYDISNLTNYAPTEIIMEQEEAKRIMDNLIISIDRYPREALPFERILIVEGAPIEFQMSILNALIKRNLITLESPLYLKLSEKGKNEVRKISESIYKL